MQKETEIWNHQDIASVLTSLGLPCSPNGYELGCSTVNYHFNLKNPMDIHRTKKFAVALAAYMHTNIKVNNSEKASFCLSLPREERYFPKYWDYAGALNNKEPGEILFGVNEHGQAITRNIRKTKSMLVAGSSGGGKSVCLNSIIASLCCYSKNFGMVLIDLKRCEFELWKNSPHLVAPVQFEYEGALKHLNAVLKEIENRYIRMQQQGTRSANLDEYPLLVVIIDEYAELASRATNKQELDTIVSRIAATGRACNVFIIIATQHAVSSIISNVIKSNLQSRIGLRTTNIAQSACILGSRDCVDLLGYGDSYMQFDGVPGLQRIQVCYLSDAEINKIEADCKPRNWDTKAPPTKTTFLQKLKSWWKQQTKKPKQTKCDNLCIADDIQTLTTTNTLNYADCVVDDDDEN